MKNLGKCYFVNSLVSNGMTKIFFEVENSNRDERKLQKCEMDSVSANLNELRQLRTKESQLSEYTENLTRF